MSEHRIVVGVDGSDRARRAVEWAVGEAGRRGISVMVVHGRPTATSLRPEEFWPLASAIVHEAVACALVVDPSIRVTGRVRAIPAIEALVEASAGADLLVVGARGSDSPVSHDLGRVSEACTARAACPVVVVRPVEADALSVG